MLKGYHSPSDGGEVKEYEMYEGDLIEACVKFPDEWSRTPPKASASKKGGKGS